MTDEELTNLRELAQQCCDTWVSILAMQHWQVTIEVTDKVLHEMPELDSCRQIASAKITLPTNDAWKTLFPDSWAQYDMEVYIVANLLHLIDDVMLAPSENIYHIARVLCALKNRGDIAQENIIKLQQQMNQEKVNAAQPVESDIEGPGNVADE